MKIKALDLRDVVAGTTNSERNVVANASFSLKNVVANIESSTELIFATTSEMLNRKMHSALSNLTSSSHKLLRNVAKISIVSILLLGTANLYSQLPVTDEISFHNMSANGNYKLMNNITVTQPYIQPFTGIFDGGGHTITVDITSNAQEVGLFSIVLNGTIKNLTITGSITSTGSNSNVGGFVGRIEGLNVAIQNCTNYVNVSIYDNLYASKIFCNNNCDTLKIINCLSHDEIINEEIIK